MDPITIALTAMAAVQKTVSMIKEASSTMDDVRSLGPLLGRYFEQKHEVTKALNQAKSNGGSNMGKAKIDAQLARDRALRAKQEREELVEICIIIGGVFLVFVLVGFGAYLVMIAKG